MQLTRIDAANASYYRQLIPEELLSDDRLLKLGLADDRGGPVCAGAVGVFGKMASLDWLYTDPGEREKGAATALLECFFRLLDGLAVDGVEAYFSRGQSDLEMLLEDRGFIVGEESGMYRIPLVDLVYSQEMDALLEDRRHYNKAVSLSAPGLWEKFTVFARKKNIPPSYLAGCSKTLSMVVFGEEEKIADGILIREIGDRDLGVNYFFGNGSVREMAGLIAGLYKMVLTRKKLEGNLYFMVKKDEILEFVEKLTGEERTAYRIQGIRHAVRMI